MNASSNKLLQLSDKIGKAIKDSHDFITIKIDFYKSLNSGTSLNVKKIRAITETELATLPDYLQDFLRKRETGPVEFTDLVSALVFAYVNNEVFRTQNGLPATHIILIGGHHQTSDLDSTDVFPFDARVNCNTRRFLSGGSAISVSTEQPPTNECYIVTVKLCPPFKLQLTEAEIAELVRLFEKQFPWITFLDDVKRVSSESGTSISASDLQTDENNNQYRDTEIADLKAKLATCQKSLQGTSIQLQKDVDAAKHDVEKADRTVRDLNKTLTDRDKEIADLQAQLEECRKQLQGTSTLLQTREEDENKTTDRDKEITDLQAQLEECRKQRQRTSTLLQTREEDENKTLTDRDNKIAALKAELEECQKQLQGTSTQLEECQKQLQGTSTQLQKDVDSAQLDVTKANKTVTDRDSEIANLKAQLEECQKRLQGASTQLQSHEEKGNKTITDLNAEIEDLKAALKQCLDKQKQAEQSTADIAQLSIKLKDCEEAVDQHLNTITTLKSQAAITDLQKEKISGLAANATQQAEAATQTIEDLKAQLQECKSHQIESEKAEEICNDKLQKCQETEKSARLHIDNLNNKITALDEELSKCRKTLASKDQPKISDANHTANGEKEESADGSEIPDDAVLKKDIQAGNKYQIQQELDTSYKSYEDRVGLSKPKNVGRVLGGGPSNSDPNLLEVMELIALEARDYYSIVRIEMSYPEVIRLLSISSMKLFLQSKPATIQLQERATTVTDYVVKKWFDYLYQDVTILPVKDVEAIIRDDVDEQISGDTSERLKQIPDQKSRKRYLRRDRLADLLRKIVKTTYFDKSQSDRKIAKYLQIYKWMGMYLTQYAQEIKSNSNLFQQIISLAPSIRDRHYKDSLYQSGTIQDENHTFNPSQVLTYVRIRADSTGVNERFKIQKRNDELLVHYRDDDDAYYMPPDFRYTYATQKNPALQRAQPMKVQKSTTKAFSERDYGESFYFGPFTRVFTMSKSNQAIAQECIEIEDTLLRGQSIFTIGYGASGAGKTSSLIYFPQAQQDVDKMGILMHLCKNKKIAEQYPWVELSIYELMADQEKPQERQEGSITQNDRFNYKKMRTPWKFLQSEKGYVLERAQEYDNQFIQPLTKNFEKGSPLGEIIIHVLNDDRLIRATGNNTNSSRSHVLVFLHLMRSSGKMPYMIVGDFAGVEQKFDCDNLDTLISFMNIQGVNGTVYRQDDQTLHDEDRYTQGYCNYSQQGGVASLETWDSDLTWLPFEKLAQEYTDDQLFGKLHIVDRIRQYVPRLSSDDLEKRLRSFFSNFKYNKVIETSMYTLGVLDDLRKEELGTYLAKTRPVIEIRSIDTAIVDMKTETIIKLLTELMKQYVQKPFKNKEDFRNALKKWQGNNMNLPAVAATDDPVGWGKFMKQLATERYENFRLFGIDFECCFKDNTYFPKVFSRLQDLWNACQAKASDFAAVLKAIWFDQKHQFYVRQKRVASIRKICACRSYEGIFINQSLHDMRAGLLRIIQHQISNSGRNLLKLAPPFLDECVTAQCNPLSDSCFSFPPSGQKIDLPKVILNMITANTDHPQVDINDLQIVVFCVINLSRSANNPPAVPYLNLTDAKLELSRINVVKSAGKDWIDQTSLSIKKTRGMLQPSDSPNVRSSVIDNIAKYLEKFQTKLGLDTTTNLRNILDVIRKNDDVATQITNLEALIQVVEKINANTAIGTLEWTDAMAKFLMTDKTCAATQSSTFPFIEDLYKRSQNNATFTDINLAQHGGFDPHSSQSFLTQWRSATGTSFKSFLKSLQN